VRSGDRGQEVARGGRRRGASRPGDAPWVVGVVDTASQAGVSSGNLRWALRGTSTPCPALVVARPPPQAERVIRRDYEAMTLAGRRPHGVKNVGRRFRTQSGPEDSGRRAEPKVPDEVRKGLPPCLPGPRRAPPPACSARRASSALVHSVNLIIDVGNNASESKAFALKDASQVCQRRPSLLGSLVWQVSHKRVERCDDCTLIRLTPHFPTGIGKLNGLPR